MLFFRWRQPRIGSEKFHGALCRIISNKDARIYREISQIGEELKMLAPALLGSRVSPEVCILYTHDNDWCSSSPISRINSSACASTFSSSTMRFTTKHSGGFRPAHRGFVQIPARVRAVVAHAFSAGEADRLKLYVQNGGTLVSTCNTGLVDEHHIAPDSGYPHNMTDLFGMEVLEFDALPPGEENHLTFKGSFPTTHLHSARLWCDLIEPRAVRCWPLTPRIFIPAKRQSP